MLKYSVNLARVAIDAVLVAIAWWISFWLRFNLDLPDEFADLAWSTAWLAVLSYTVGMLLSGVDRHVWRYVSLLDLRRLGWGLLLGGLLCAASILMLRFPNFPRSVLLLHPLITLLLLGAVRAGMRTLAERGLSYRANGRPLVIVGSLADASDALRGLKGSQQWQPVGIVSPVTSEVGHVIQDVRVLGPSGSLGRVCAATGAKTAVKQ